MSEEDWEDEDASSSFPPSYFHLLTTPFTISSDVLQTGVTVTLYGLAFALLCYFCVAVYRTATHKDDPYGGGGRRKKKQDPNAAFKDYSRGGEEEEGKGGGFIPRAIGTAVESVFKAFDSAPSPPSAPAFEAVVSCIPFGCPPPRMAAGFAIDESSGLGYMYGGFDDKGFRSDMYAFAAGECEWTNMGTPAEEREAEDAERSPGKRVHVRMVSSGRSKVERRGPGIRRARLDVFREIGGDREREMSGRARAWRLGVVALTMIYCASLAIVLLLPSFPFPFPFSCFPPPPHSFPSSISPPPLFAHARSPSPTASS